MDRAVQNALRNAVASCRQLLEESIADVLEGRFGIHRSGIIEEDVVDVGHLSGDERADRDRVTDYLGHLQAGGLKPAEAVARLVREAAFTQLNRLCAYKMLEQLGLIRETVNRGTNSSGFKFYLADNPHDERLCLEGQQEPAYRHFLDWTAGVLAQEVGVLFSQDDPKGRLMPPQHVLDQVLARVNAAELDGVWGKDETIGWVYQYFTPKQAREQSRKESRAPRNAHELAFRNQFYTPRYVVEFLTDNTLGRLWYEMRCGDTRLAESCRLLVRRTGENPSRAKKDPREIRVLDPACGSGHFLLYCFDLLLIVYQEAYTDPDLGRALKRDYPTREALMRAAPQLILSQNLHGIDIDPRAVQIASFALWLHAQRAYAALGVSPGDRPKIERMNIVCAGPMPAERDMLEAFVAGLTPRVLGQLVREICWRMERADEIGSLLQIEGEISGLVADAKTQWLAQPKPEQLSLFPVGRRPERAKQLEFDFSGITDEEFWREAEARVIDSLREYAQRAGGGSAFARELFSGDAAQGFAFVDLCRQRFDVILMNPPFGEATKHAKSYIEKNLPRAKHDQACAFVERWLARCAPGGMLGAITTRTPFFLSSGAAWRQEVILKPGALELFADLGYGVLEAMVETAAYTLSQEAAPAPRPATFLRVLEDDDKAAAIAAVVESRSDGRRFEVHLSSFAQVPNSPLCYWASERIRRLFQELPPFEGEGRTVRQGLATADDFRFVRLWTEVPPEKIGRKWFPFAKGGEYSPYYADVHLVVNWEDDGREIRAFTDPATGKLNSRPQNTDFYFRPGLTWPLRAHRYSPAALPAGSIFSVRGYAIIAEPGTLSVLAAVGNSQLFDFLFKVLLGRFGYPEFIVGVLQQLPTPRIAGATAKSLARLGLDQIDLKRNLDRANECCHLFVVPAAVQLSGSTIDDLARKRSHHVDQTRCDLRTNQLKIEDMVFQLYGMDVAEQASVEPTTLGAQAQEPCPSTAEDGEKEGFTGRQLIDDLLSWSAAISFGRFDVRMATGEKPIPVLPEDPFAPLPVCSPGMLVGDDGLPAKEAPPGYPIVIDCDGILVDDPSHPDDIVKRVRGVLDLIWAERAEAIEREACEILEVADLRDYFRNPQGFFAHHIRRYSKSHRKAPIYWLLQSPKKNYGLWLYYHRLDKDILFKALTLYVERKVRLEEQRLTEMLKRQDPRVTGRALKDLEKVVDQHDMLLSDLREFHARLDRAAKYYLTPDLDDGVILNIAPLWELVPWNEAKIHWDELLAGKYAWSSIGRQLREKGLVE